MTTVTSAEIEAYVAQVGAALADLDEDVRADLLEDLPDHLAEVFGDGERLGDPADYAAELRAAAGLPPAGARDHAAPRIADLYARVREQVDTADRALGALLGYGRAGEMARALRPGWWVLRGWIVALMLRGAFLHGHWTSFVIPIGHGPALEGWLLIVGCVIASSWLGRRVARGTKQTRVISVLASVLIAVFGIFIARNLVGWDYQRYGGYEGTSVIYAPATPAPSMTP